MTPALLDNVSNQGEQVGGRMFLPQQEENSQMFFLQHGNLCCHTRLHCTELTCGVASTGIIANKNLQHTMCCNAPSSFDTHLECLFINKDTQISVQTFPFTIPK